MAEKANARELLALFEQMEREHWRYRWGGASRGEVDCSGAFVYAYRALGLPKIEHSSNALARRDVLELLPMREARAGYACFLHRAQREDTPARWRDGRGDYYHVGLMGEDGRVLNAKGAKVGFTKSDAAGYAFCGALKAINYGDEAGGAWDGVIRTPGGGRVNLRASAELRAGNVLTLLPCGTAVRVLSEAENGFLPVQAGEYAGYCALEYVARA